MVHFTFDIDNPAQQFVKITARFIVNQKDISIKLPSWRPGRYELANFAQNIKNFQVYNEKGDKVFFEKTSKDVWNLKSNACNEVKIQYLYYANVLNAGSSFLDQNQLYVNPVNCCVYTEEEFDKNVEIKLNIPNEWSVATSMLKVGEAWTAENFNELFDSPFIASNGLQVEKYESHGTTFHVWFNGEIKPDWSRLLKDFKSFTDKQIEKFTEFPVKEYHFLNQILPFKAYHGVEHQKSTVITLGPSYDVFGKNYKELLGVSSHELYHTWNVKMIRPIEMHPYNFQQENYSKLGYLCEGVTTYQGDLMLLKSGVFSEDQYFVEFNAQLQKHFDNPARFNYSVADSSFDTWLDGYIQGIPGRKVSIYTEGCLLAFVTDIKIRKATKNKYGIDEVIKRLFFNYALKNKGVSESDYQKEIESLAGISFQGFFDRFVNGNDPYESIITESLNYIGLELNLNPSKKYSESKLGMKLISEGKDFKVQAIYPGGPAELAALSIGDIIIAINGYSCDGEINKWMKYFDEDDKTLTIKRAGILSSITIPEVDRNFYMEYSIKKLDNPNNQQKSAYQSWKK